MNENEWRQLVNNALNNDEAAFDRLYKETERSVYFLCLKFLGNEQDAKDAAQETYLAAFNGLSTLDDGANFPKWINGIAVNQCKRFLRTPKNESLDEKLEHGVDFSDDENFIPEDYVANAEKRKVIMNIIDTELSEVQRQTIILYYYNGLKTNEIASIMNCPEGTVTYRLSAARAKIKEAVLIYEKENKDRLHAIVPIPILTLILRSEAESTVVPDIRLFKNPAASANHLKTGGKTMLNTLKAKIIAGACAAAVVGGGVTAGVLISNNSKNKTESRPAVSAPANVSKPANASAPANSSTPANSSKPADSSAAESTPTQSVPQYKPVTMDRAGFSITYPADYRAHPYINDYDTEKHIRVKNIGTKDEIHIQYEYLVINDDKEYQPEDVREILHNNLYFLNTSKNYNYGTINEDFYDHYLLQWAEYSVDEEEYLEIDGYPFLKQSGILTLERAYGGTYDNTYVAYYAVLPPKKYGKVPFVLFFNTRSTKPEVIAEMKETAKNVAENGFIVGDER